MEILEGIFACFASIIALVIIGIGFFGLIAALDILTGKDPRKEGLFMFFNQKDD